ncbi:CDP-alcohol phosphatidyltransferase family protein [Stieleria sp. JC731]|uniref:CDP-alcohol phosphatidyltransferase family protein n=1 Tax=Pirellulaceae TaxID=2691357 RepID=UPI001E3C5D4C|nr:CDP-alcohol phosphatidyltransferase family protein [Stieleria sp. JC731]MCC9600230.1 CDP-alcohol phosphatidyltransferase family protein [Stieleria sp. JC731]
MPSVYDLKPKFQSVLRPVVRFLASQGVTANQVTLFAVLISVCQGLLVVLFPMSWWALAMMPVVLLIRMGLNAIDGMLAREFNQKSNLGAILNELGDIVSDVCLYLPLALVSQLSVWLLVLFVVLAVIVEFAGMTAIQVGGERRYDGPMGKSDRAFWVGLLSTLLAAGWINASVASGYLVCLIFLSVISVWNRCRKALQLQTAI